MGYCRGKGVMVFTVFAHVYLVLRKSLIILQELARFN
nr:MAG TPA: hypothetical protein [Caudoviricetes sp.]